METFRSLRLKESKEAIIRKMPNLTGEQKDEAIQFFNKYNAFEKEVDWNKWKTLTWEDLKAVITKDRNTKAQIRKKIKTGLEGFIEGKDYDILAEGEWKGEPYVAYIPYTWEASRMIASPSVPPVKLKYNVELGKTEPVAAKWCTAHNTDESYWHKHTSGPDFSAFIYLCGETIPTKKIAIELNGEGKETNCDGMGFGHFVLKKEDGKILHSDADYINYNYWDFNDNYDTFKSNQIPDMRPYFLRALEEMEKRRDELLKDRYEGHLDKSLQFYNDTLPFMPSKEEVKKVIMKNFDIKVWGRASVYVSGKGEVDEDFALCQLCRLNAQDAFKKGWVDTQKLNAYIEENGLSLNPTAVLFELYVEEGAKSVKPFFTQEGLDQYLTSCKKMYRSLDGVIFLMVDSYLESNLIN